MSHSINNFVVELSHLTETLQFSMEKWRTVPAACSHLRMGLASPTGAKRENQRQS